MSFNQIKIEKRLQKVSDDLRANSNLKSSEYFAPVLGLVFLRYADYKFTQSGTPYLPPEARYQYLLDLPEQEDITTALVTAIKAIETANEELRDVLPRDYGRLEKPVLRSLLKTLNFDLKDINEDVFGEIYQYFLGNFSQKEGQKGGEFFTPISIVKLIVEIVEPDQGRILDPACGAGGMFIQSALFTQRRKGASPNNFISVYGQEKVDNTRKLCQMNLAVHGISGLKNIATANSYYEDLYDFLGTFDFVLANPPFNVNGVDKNKLKAQCYPFGVPTPDNANYLWISLFYTALNRKGRAGFVMPNSASDARGTELTIRQQLITTGAVDVMIAVGSNFFYTVTLPCTLWFFDKGKINTNRQNKVLFIDARHLYDQIDRAHRQFNDLQVEFIANIVRLYRGETVENQAGSEELLQQKFPDGVYLDIAGLCRVATITEIESQGWSLNPGRYVGVAEREEGEDFDFTERLEELNEELEILNSEGRDLEVRIGENIALLLNK